MWPKEASFQYTDQEWMSEDEYDLLIDDPTDFLYHYYLPRVATGLSGFAKLASPLDMIEIVAGTSWMMRWADPDVQASIAALTKAGQECAAWGGDDVPAASAVWSPKGSRARCSTCPRPRSTSSAIRFEASAA